MNFDIPELKIISENVENLNYKFEEIKNAFTQSRMMTIDEAAKFLGVHRQTIYNLRKRGIIKAYEWDGITRFDERELRESGKKKG